MRRKWIALLCAVLMASGCGLFHRRADAPAVSDDAPVVERDLTIPRDGT